MDRGRGTDTRGTVFTQARIDEVWERTAKVRGKKSSLYRRDVAKHILYKSSYGVNSEMGWEIDHIKPVIKGGTDNLRNLQALQTATNRAKGSTYPWMP